MDEGRDGVELAEVKIGREAFSRWRVFIGNFVLEPILGVTGGEGMRTCRHVEQTGTGWQNTIWVIEILFFH